MDDKNLFDLTGKVALITGGHSWLGRDMADVLAAHGADIIVTSRKLERAEEAAARIGAKFGVNAVGLALDQREHAEVAAMAEAAFAWRGKVDILINNAGGGSGASEGNFFKRDPGAVVDLIRTNLIGALFCCQEIGKRMAERKSGKIVNIGSIAGLVGRNREMYRKNAKMEQPVDYAASKAGVIGMTRDIAAFMAPYGVTANCISPGGFDKGDLPAGFVDDYAAETMPGRMGAMGRDLKGVALFLASPASDYVSGQNFVVDGGFTVYK